MMLNLNDGKAILTSNKHKTGSDRIFECYEKLDLKNIDYIFLNVTRRWAKHWYKWFITSK